MSVFSRGAVPEAGPNAGVWPQDSLCNRGAGLMQIRPVLKHRSIAFLLTKTFFSFENFRLLFQAGPTPKNREGGYLHLYLLLTLFQFVLLFIATGNRGGG